MRPRQSRLCVFVHKKKKGGSSVEKLRSARCLGIRHCKTDSLKENDNKWETEALLVLDVPSSLQGREHSLFVFPLFPSQVSSFIEKAQACNLRVSFPSASQRETAGGGGTMWCVRVTTRSYAQYQTVWRTTSSSNVGSFSSFFFLLLLFCCCWCLTVRMSCDILAKKNEQKKGGKNNNNS